MKKIATMLLIMLCANCWAQTKVQVNNLSKLAKAWGFLKYYHPAVAKGEVDWDLKLIKLIPIAMQESSQEFNHTLTSCYFELPEAKISSFIIQPKGDSILKIFDEKDIKDFNLDKRLITAFIQLYSYHLPDSSRYITNKYKQYTLDFILNTEDSFDEQDYPSPEVRLLALFRYWNIINYQFPHKKLVPQHWDKILPKYIPIFWQAKDQWAYRNAVQKLATEMEDSHAFYKEESYDKNQSFNVAFDLKKIKGSYYVSGFYNADLAKIEDIQKGDEIMKINNIPVKTYEKVKLCGVTGSNRHTKYRDQAKQLLRVDTVKNYQLVVRRHQQFLTLNVSRYTWAQLNDKGGKVKADQILNWKEIIPGVWHVKFCSITTEHELKEMFEAIKTAKKVIWDMRGYPVYALLKQTFASLMPHETVLGTNINANLYFPGTFTLRKEIYYPEKPMYASYAGKMIVLVNEQTQSLAESVSAQLALRPNTIIIGRQTAGTTGNINYLDLPGKISTSFTSVGFMGANNSFVQKKGVKINIKMKISLEEVKNNVDALLQKALAEN